jgi:predicted nuclease of predicted toxin-antitoxin system
MKFIIDENLPPRLAAWLRERGHDAVHVVDTGLTGQADTNIVALARQEQRTVITQDSDFDDAADIRVVRIAFGNARTAALLTWLEPQIDDAIARIGAGDRLVILN